MRRFSTLLIFTLTVLLIGPSLASAPALYIPLVQRPPAPTPTATPSNLAYVTYVVDGDTIDVQIGGTIYRVRYIGIDTPEIGGTDCYGPEAKAQNRALVEGQWVRLEKDVSETDRYGRLLRYVYVGSLFINAELVRAGYARAYTYPPDVAHAAEFVALEQEARAAGRGLWSACTTPTATHTPTPQSQATATATSIAGPCTCISNIYNCGDFSTQAQAQACFEHCWQVTGQDIHQLDSDNDGEACESLP